MQVPWIIELCHRDKIDSSAWAIAGELEIAQSDGIIEIIES